MAGLALLMTVGLTVPAVAGVVALRSYLLERTDNELRAAQGLLTVRSVAALAGIVPTVSAEGLRQVVAPTNYVVELRRVDSTVQRVVGDVGRPLPARPLLDVIDDLPARAASGRPFTVFYGDRRYRVLVGTLPGTGMTDVVAVPLQPVVATLARLVAVETVAGAAALVFAGVSAWLLLGHGLRPVRDVAATAAAIATGDLSRRVPDHPPRSETGQLAAAINTMLGQIQSAFDDRVRSEERLRRFVADASHELRTPLTSVRGYVDLLRQGIVPPAEVDDALRRVSDETRRMGALVDDMLYLAHLDEERPLLRAEVDLVVLVRDAVRDATVVEPARPVTLRLPESCSMVADADALRQVIGNLLTNVRVHAPVTAMVTVELTRNDRRMVLRVHDDGPGMPPEVAERIFDRFYRASGGRDRGHGGNGLGMSIVAAVAAAHGGTAEVSSTLGAGTTITITLPVRPSVRDQV
ncbi:sensor histidine kinase [Candidatus Protofrankia datiscae]|nr:HAMP domain-containing sensor histidine kinase [Candidatus Protofrankia datiscae]